MKRSTTILATTLLATLAIWSGPQILAALREPPGGDRPAVAYFGSATKLGTGYERWAADHEARGGDRNVNLALRWSKGLSVEFSNATGQARLDLVAGSVLVEVRGLQGPGWEVWLVDNQPGPGRSVAPEPGDKLIHVGRLQVEGDVARLEARLGPGAFNAFEMDLVVVARPGGEMWTRGVLFGAPGLFQRLYTRARTGRPAKADEASSALLFSWTGPVAHATTTTVVASLDPLDVRGADLFFNETFKGNGLRHLSPGGEQLHHRSTLHRHPASQESAMHQLGLIVENFDGFDDLPNKFVMRDVPHIFALNLSMTPAP